MNELKTRLITKQKLPLVVEPSDPNITLKESLSLLHEHNEFFKSNLLNHGGLLFRNFPIHDVEGFSELVKALDTGKFISYIGGDSPRNIVKDGIYTSTEAPPSVKIPLHNELSFVNKYPSHIYFYCQVAPEKDGQTILGDARQIFKAVDPNVRDKFVKRKLKYTSAYYNKSALMDFVNKLQPSHKSWHQVFETDDKKEVERLCRENDFKLVWNKNDWLQISQTRPAIMQHAVTGEDVWFNQAHLYDFNPRLLGIWRYLAAKLFYIRPYTKLHEVAFADGSAIPLEDLYHIMDVLDQNTLYFPWQKGDVLVLDNVLSMHGRATFHGKRRILTAMTGK